MAFGISRNTLQRAFTCVQQKQQFDDGANYRRVQNQQLIQRIVNYLADIFTFYQYGKNTEAEIGAKRAVLKNIEPTIYDAVCEAAFGRENFCSFKIADAEKSETFFIIQFGCMGESRLRIVKDGEGCDDSNNYKELPFRTLEELRSAMDKARSKMNST